MKPTDPLADLPPTEPLRSGGVTLRVRRLPAPAAPDALRLILLHGGPGLDHHVLLPLGLALAERHEVWLPDLPGHGASVAPHGAGSSPPGLRAMEGALGRWLRGLEEDEGRAGAQGGARTVLVGHSLGAFLVRELLRPARPPLPVGAAVLLSPPAAGQRERGSALRRAGSLARRERSGSVRHGSRKQGRARREVLAHVEAETDGAPSPLFLAALDRARLRDTRLYAALGGEVHRRLVAAPEACDPGVPVLVLCGERDRTTPPEQARRVAEGLSGATLELLPGAGHYPFADALEATAAAIERFLDQRTR